MSALDRRAARRPGAGRERERWPRPRRRPPRRERSGRPSLRRSRRARTRARSGRRPRAPSDGAERDGQQRFQSSPRGEDDSPLALDHREPRFTVAATHVERTGDDGGRDGDQRPRTLRAVRSPATARRRFAWRARQPTRASSTRRSAGSGRRGTRVRRSSGSSDRGAVAWRRRSRRGALRVQASCARTSTGNSYVFARITATDRARDLVELLAVDEQERRKGRIIRIPCSEAIREVDPVRVVAVRVERQVDGADGERDGADRLVVVRRFDELEAAARRSRARASRPTRRRGHRCDCGPARAGRAPARRPAPSGRRRAGCLLRGAWPPTCADPVVVTIGAWSTGAAARACAPRHGGPRPCARCRARAWSRSSAPRRADVSSASFAFSDSLSTAARSSGPPAAAIATRADEQTTAARIDQCCKRTNGAFPQSARGMTRP